MNPGKPLQLTTDPICTGTSVIGLKYKAGVMLAADTQGCYGGLLRFKDF
jgi:20S proteasome subunit beta 7